MSDKQAKRFVQLMQGTKDRDETTGGLSADAAREVAIAEKRKAILERREAMGQQLQLQKRQASELVTSIATSAAVVASTDDPHTAVAKRDYTVAFTSNNPANLVGRYHAFKIKSKFPVPGAAIFDDLRRRKLIAASQATEDKLALERVKREEAAIVRTQIVTRSMDLRLETGLERTAVALGKAIDDTSKALEAAGHSSEMTLVGDEAQQAVLEHVRRKHVIKVEQAFERGEVLVNAVEPSMQNTGLILAVQAGLLSLTRLYLKYGGDPNRHNLPGQVPLHVAWSSWLRQPSGSPKRGLQLLVVTDIVKELILYGAAPNITNHNSQTALHLAANYGHEDIVACLLHAGGDVTMRDRWGRSPHDCALRRLAVDEAKGLDDVSGGTGAADASRKHKACAALLANWHHITKARKMHDFRAAWSHAMATNASEFRSADAETRKLRQAQLVRTAAGAGASGGAGSRAGDESPLAAAGRRAGERLWGRQVDAFGLVRGMELQEEMRLRNHVSRLDVQHHLMALPELPSGSLAIAKAAIAMNEGASDAESESDIEPGEPRGDGEESDGDAEAGEEGLTAKDAAKAKERQEHRAKGRRARRRSIVGDATAVKKLKGGGEGAAGGGKGSEKGRVSKAMVLARSKAGGGGGKYVGEDASAAQLSKRSDGRLGLMAEAQDVGGVVSDTTEADFVRRLQHKQHARRKWVSAQRDVGHEVEAHIRKDLMRKAMGIDEAHRAGRGETGGGMGLPPKLEQKRAAMVSAAERRNGLQEEEEEEEEEEGGGASATVGGGRGAAVRRGARVPEQPAGGAGGGGDGSSNARTSAGGSGLDARAAAARGIGGRTLWEAEGVMEVGDEAAGRHRQSDTAPVFVDAPGDGIERGLKAVRAMRRRRAQAAREVAADASGIEGRKGRVKLDSGEVYVRRPALRTALLKGTRMRVDHVQRAGAAPLAGVYTGKRAGEPGRDRSTRSAGRALWDAQGAAVQGVGGGAVEDMGERESVRALADDDSVVMGGRVAGDGGDAAIGDAMDGLAVGVAEAEVRVLKREVKAPLSRRLLPVAGAQREQMRRELVEARQEERRRLEAERQERVRQRMLELTRKGEESAFQAGRGGGLLGLKGQTTLSGAHVIGDGPSERTGAVDAAEASAKASVFRMMGWDVSGRPLPAHSGDAAAGKGRRGQARGDADSPNQPDYGPLHLAGGLPAASTLAELSRFDLIDDIPGRGVTRVATVKRSAVEEVRRQRAQMEAGAPGRSKSSKYAVLEDMKQAARLTKYGRFPVPEEPQKFATFDVTRPVHGVEM